MPRAAAGVVELIAMTVALIQRAIGQQLACAFVDHGLPRQGESKQVCRVFSEFFPMHFVRVDAAKRFFGAAGMRRQFRIDMLTDKRKKRL